MYRYFDHKQRGGGDIWKFQWGNETLEMGRKNDDNDDGYTIIIRYQQQRLNHLPMDGLFLQFMWL